MPDAEESPLRIQRFRRVDRTFVAITAGVFLFNFGLASAIAGRAKTWTDDWALTEEVLSSGQISTFFPRPQAVAREDEGKKPARPGPRGKVASLEPGRRGVPARPAESLEHLVKSVGLTKMLGAAGLGNGLQIQDDLWSGHEGASLEKAMKEAAGSGARVRLDGGGDRRGSEQGEVRTIGDLGTGGGAGQGARLGDRGPVAPRPRVTFEDEDDPPVSSPGCDRVAIARVVKRGLSALQACYEHETKKIPSLKGKVVVRFTIGTDGRATDVEIDEDSVGSSGLRRCLERSFRYWSFPASPGECVVSHPFVFAPVP